MPVMNIGGPSLCQDVEGEIRIWDASREGVANLACYDVKVDSSAVFQGYFDRHTMTGQTVDKEFGPFRYRDPLHGWPQLYILLTYGR